MHSSVILHSDIFLTQTRLCFFKQKMRTLYINIKQSGQTRNGHIKKPTMLEDYMLTFLDVLCFTCMRH